MKVFNKCTRIKWLQFQLGQWIWIRIQAGHNDTQKGKINAMLLKAFWMARGFSLSLDVIFRSRKILRFLVKFYSTVLFSHKNIGLDLD
jgi:hypothetical protein